jgi:L-ascorbate 6-phosphate lactonase
MTGVVRLRWLGQSGFVLSAGPDSVVIDPWFSDHELRLAAAPTIDDVPDGTAWLLATHGHVDHLDLPALPSLALRFPELAVVVPSPLVDRVSAVAPHLRVHGVQPGDTVGDDRVRIDVVPAWHGVTVADGYSPGPAGADTPHVGYVVRLGGVAVLHTGDTISARALIDAIRPHRVDVALLPTNGRDAEREAAEILGNFDATEAADFAAAIGTRIVVPMHYEMVRGNTAPVGDLPNAIARLGLPITVVIPSRYEPVDVCLGEPT